VATESFLTLIENAQGSTRAAPRSRPGQRPGPAAGQFGNIPATRLNLIAFILTAHPARPCVAASRQCMAAFKA